MAAVEWERMTRGRWVKQDRSSENNAEWYGNTVEGMFWCGVRTLSSKRRRRRGRGRRGEEEGEGEGGGWGGGGKRREVEAGHEHVARWRKGGGKQRAREQERSKRTGERNKGWFWFFKPHFLSLMLFKAEAHLPLLILSCASCTGLCTTSGRLAAILHVLPYAPSCPQNSPANHHQTTHKNRVMILILLMEEQLQWDWVLPTLVQ